MATGGATPRKFAEKIAMHNQKGAEENAEFNKIMSEIARVKGNAAVGSMQSPRPPPTLTNPLMLVGGPRIHLSPNFPSAVPRHGSLPNVNAGVNFQQQAPQGGNVAMNNQPINPMFTPMETGTNAMINQASSPMTILNPNATHSSLRDSMVGTSGGSATQIHTIRGTSGPIRSHKHRKDTSPYGSDRLSSTGMPASTSHLSPPDNSGAWRRVRSDPFLHHNSVNGSSTGVSPAGSISDTPNAILGSNGAISPLQAASPTCHRRVPGNVSNSGTYNTSQLPATNVNNVQNPKNSYQLGLPETGGGPELKPGSLPNLTDLDIGHHSSGANADSVQSSHPIVPPGGGSIMQNNEESPISSSMSATSGGSSPYVRLSDNEISKILQIPVSLVSEGSSGDIVADTANSAKSTNAVSSVVCDNASRNLLHLNKGIAVEQSNSQQNNIMYGTNMQIKTEDGQNLVDISSMSTYRNPQSIQPPPSPVMQGSPINRSASPIDFVGSPHSPLAGQHALQQHTAVNYPDAMALAGPNQHFMDLTNEVQKMSVLENQPSNEQGMYIPTTRGYSTQPIESVFDFINNQQQLDSKNNYQEPNPQTPSSIPDIILTADDGSDQAIQRMLGMNNDLELNFLEGDLKEGLGKLDDNMMRLLSDNGTMDQLADPATEEHLKKV